MKLKVTVSTTAGAAITRKLRPLAAQAAKVALPQIAALVVDKVLASTGTSRTEATAYQEAFDLPGGISLKGTKLTIKLATPLAQAIEFGNAAFDIKAKMLAKAKKFARSGGPYVDVPFQHAATAGAKNLQGMPPEVRAALTAAVAKAKSSGISAGMSKGAAATQTVRLKNKMPGKTFEKDLMLGGTAHKVEVTHKVGIHQDMIRTAVMGPKRAISKYQTIRRISANSNATSWWHPGFKGKHLLQKALTDVRKQLEAIIRDAYKGVGLKARLKK